MSASRSIIVSRLRENPIFASLGDEDLESLAAVMKYRKFPKGAFIVTKNETTDSIYMLAVGRVKVSIASPEGREFALNYLEAPTYFGEMAGPDAEIRSADVIATTDVELLVIEGKDMEKVFQVQPRLAVTLINTLSERLRELVVRLEGMAFHDATHRVMRVMLNVATASYESRGVPVIEGLTHYEIATLAGTSRETASRVVSNLAREGIVATKGRKIVVDLFGLRDIVEKD